MKRLNCALALLAAPALLASAAFPAAEKLDRGVVAVTTSSGTFISWRSLTTDDPAMTFDVFRDGEKINASPIKTGTNYTDKSGTPGAKYVVKANVGDRVVETSPETAAESDVYRRLKLDRPKGSGCTYTPNDMSVGDTDGDGQYELFVKWDPSNSHDNSENGGTGHVFIDCYTLQGKKLWRVDLGQNIRAGAHYTQFLVYDFDRDGKAEMICKTAPGTKDGLGRNVIMGSDDPAKSYVNSKGHVISGPEYLTVFDGATGAEIHTIAYNPPRDIHPQEKNYPGWGDTYGGRSERYLAGVAYLDGQNPSAVFCRGYYTHSYLWAVDYRNGKLSERWLHASTEKNKGAYGEGAHSLTIGDCDGDGYDEIVYGSAAIDHDGSLLYRTGGGHGDALHLGDFDPDRKGLEVFMVHEDTDTHPYDAEFRDAATGRIIWSLKASGNDIGRGMAADISGQWRGHEIWPSNYFGNGEKQTVTFDCKGNAIADKRAGTCFRIYWDGDPYDELFDGAYNSSTKSSAPVIAKRNSAASGDSKTWEFSKYNAQSCNTTKATPCLQADILGDWREELILWDAENPAEIMIFTTTEKSSLRIPCLMEDHNYRLAIAWQNVGYNQPPHLSYSLADRYSTSPRIIISEGDLNQTLEEGQAIRTISGSYDKAITVSAAGLPSGVTFKADPSAKTFTISGTPAKAGNYIFTLTAIGNTETFTMKGSITVEGVVQLERVAHFSFDEVGATVVNHVEGEATAVGAPEAIEGKAAGAIRFNGTTDYLTQETYDLLQLGASDFTIEMLLRSNDDASYILHKGSISATEAEGATGCWIGFEYKGGNLKFGIDDNASKTDLTFPGTACFDNEWHHIVLTRGAGKLKAYVDGTLMGETADLTGAIADNRERLVIGNVNNSFSNFFAGDLDDLSIYTGAMTASKVKERLAAYTSSGVISVNATPMQPKLLTVYDLNGVEIARGVGEPENLTRSLEPGLYILLTEQGPTRTVTKIRL